MTIGRDAQPDCFHGDDQARYLNECRSVVRFMTRQIAHELDPRLIGPVSRKDIAHYQQRRRWCFLEARRVERERRAGS